MTYDTIIIGGGFYGCVLGLFLKQHGYRVMILERDQDILRRASYSNQARIHNGYHYPRSFMTAWRSRINFPHFVEEYQACVDDTFEKLYAIARHHSKVNAYQFKRFCENIDAPAYTAPSTIKSLFNDELIEEVFVVQEYAFNAHKLREIVREQLQKNKITTLLNSTVNRVSRTLDGQLQVQIETGEKYQAQTVLNCTYGQLNYVLHGSDTALLPLKHQIAEIALVEVPEELTAYGITVMDGSFFSVMPFPAEKLHSLSHVRYTHHESWFDLLDGYRDPYAYLDSVNVRSNYPYMIRDAQRYVPILEGTKHIRSLFEIKTLSMNNEADDGRPILFRENAGIPNFYNIMGGKIDNIYDIMKKLEQLVANGSFIENNSA